MTQYAEVLIPLALPRNYTWRVPDSLAGQVKTGCRVEVVLGKTRKYAGLVKALHNTKPAAFEPKEILGVLDDQPIVYPNQLKLWAWLSSYYMCSEGEVMAAALPTHFKLSSETVLLFNEEFGENFSELDHDEYLVAEALLIKKELRITEVQQVLDSSHVYPVVKRLIEKKCCFVWEEMIEKYKPRLETYITLHPRYQQEEQLAELLNNWSRAPKQMELLLAWLHLQKTTGEVSRTELLKKSDASAAQLKGLLDKEILIAEKRQVGRLANPEPTVSIDFMLTEPQQKALIDLRNQLQEKPVALLHGVTSSGKTQVYIRLMEQELLKGNQILYMLPEIALTAQVIRRLQKHFGGHIAVYHSRFSANERVELWNKVKQGEVSVVLGARSSLFLPFRNLSLVVVDEEHDSSFKQQDPAPRYNARDAAIYYASLFGAKTILGSATPSIETYYNATQGKYGLVELTGRYRDIEMPAIETVDLRNVNVKGAERVILSPQLKEGMEQMIGQGKQVILFQNRRGYTPYQICQVCGWIPHCKHCDVSLTYHKFKHKLQCHYCGTTYPPLHTCEACGNHQFAQRNFGTEQIEELLIAEFPKARIARMDMDSVRGRHAHDAMIQLFEQGRTDILIGTQMVVKGLDFDNVGLVGILDADGLLGFSDFRANERAFQLMEQVSGRAGRKGAVGRVMIQAQRVGHPVLKYVQEHDYKAFFKDELEKRKQFQYPPFTRLVMIRIKHKKPEVVKSAADRYAGLVRVKYDALLTGPAEPVIARIRGQYIRELLMKIPRDSQALARCKQFLLEQTAVLQSVKEYKSVVIQADVDPF